MPRRSKTKIVVTLPIAVGLYSPNLTPILIEIVGALKSTSGPVRRNSKLSAIKNEGRLWNWEAKNLGLRVNSKRGHRVYGTRIQRQFVIYDLKHIRRKHW